MNGRVLSINISEKKGTPKTKINPGVLVEDFGFEGDAHAGKWHRQVSLLAKESIEKSKGGICVKNFVRMEIVSFIKHTMKETIILLSLNVKKRMNG